LASDDMTAAVLFVLVLLVLVLVVLATAVYGPTVESQASE